MERKKKVKKEPVSSPSTGRVQRMVPELATLSYTVTGNRQYQQDAVYVSKGKKLAANKKTRVLAVVCDGMGGWAGWRQSKSDGNPDVSFSI